MRQRTFFDAEISQDDNAKRHARKTDAVSSHEAAERAESFVASQCREVLEGLKLHDRSTSAELAAACGMDRFMVARRLPDLSRNELVVRGPVRRCLVNGTNAIEWRLA